MSLGHVCACFVDRRQGWTHIA